MMLGLSPDLAAQIRIEYIFQLFYHYGAIKQKPSFPTQAPQKVGRRILLGMGLMALFRQLCYLQQTPSIR